MSWYLNDYKKLGNLRNRKSRKKRFAYPKVDLFNRRFALAIAHKHHAHVSAAHKLRWHCRFIFQNSNAVRTRDQLFVGFYWINQKPFQRFVQLSGIPPKTFTKWPYINITWTLKIQQLNAIECDEIYQMIRPSNDPEKNSVPVLEFIHNTELTASWWHTSRSLIATKLLSALVSHAPTCPEWNPLTKVVGSFGLYSKQMIGLGARRFSSGLFGFSANVQIQIKFRLNFHNQILTNFPDVWFTCHVICGALERCVTVRNGQLSAAIGRPW